MTLHSGRFTNLFCTVPSKLPFDWQAFLGKPLISEHGNMTEKCSITQELIEDIVGYPTPDVDVRPEPLTFKHDDISALEAANFWRNLGQVEMVRASEPIPMELLTVNQVKASFDLTHEIIFKGSWSTIWLRSL